MIIPTKHDGFFELQRRVYDSGGGSSAPAQQTQISDLPAWAQPYAQSTLAKTDAVTQTPFQQYTGDRQAQFTPLQQQAFQGASDLQPSAMGAQAGGIAGLASQKALGTSYSPYQPGGFDAATAGKYMSPYVQNVVNTQLQEAQRQSDIEGTKQQSDATMSGAYGGGRDAIMRSERERNLGTLDNQIVAQGYQQAYNQGQQQFNTENQLGEQSKQFGAGLGLQGLQTALTGANTMGQIGQQQFGQSADTARLQDQMGTQQQGNVQSILDQQYNDFQTQQRYPYQQLEFESNMIRGTPTGTTSTLYTAAPNSTAQLAGLGTAAYGLSKMLAKGGRVRPKKTKKGSGLGDLMVSKIA